MGMYSVDDEIYGFWAKNMRSRKEDQQGNTM